MDDLVSEGVVLGRAASRHDLAMVLGSGRRPLPPAQLRPVQEALNGVQMTLSLGGENVTVLDLDADFAAELARLAEA
jgi:hypothetical protein